MSLELSGAPRTEAEVARTVQQLLARHPEWLGGVALRNVAVSYTATLPAVPGRPQTVVVQFVQQVRGIPVEGTMIHGSVTLLDGRSVLASIGSRLYPGASLSPQALLSDAVIERKIREAAAALGHRGSLIARRVRLRHIDGAWRRVAEGRVADHDGKIIVDEQAGGVWVEDDRVYATVNGRARGRGVAFHPVATGSDLVTLDLASLAVGVASGNSTFTDAAGLFDFPMETSPTNVNAQLAGRWAAAVALQGVPLTFSGSATPGVPLEVWFNPLGTLEFAIAQVNGYYHTHFIHEWVAARLGGSLPGMNLQIPVRVNYPDTCNAFYVANTITFYQAGGGCINTAYDTVVYHEYGHFIDDAAGGIINGGLSEGWGDILAAFASGQPLLGEGFGGTLTSFIRTADNAYQYPPNGQDEVHALGQAWAGFAWHLRQNLIASEGPSAGVALAEQLVIPVFLANSPDIPSAVLQVLLRDDDDGNLANGTPHQTEIFSAAGRHQIPIPEDDAVAPSPVNDLSVSSAGMSRVTLAWTATGDDGLQGRAFRYDLRYAATPITNEADFLAAQPVSGMPVPQLPGQPEQFTVAGLAPETLHYFAIKVTDNVYNASLLSNQASASTGVGVVLVQEEFDAGDPGWTADGLWHRSQQRASSPAHSYAYNNGVDYETGARNAGSLTSPPIAIPSSAQEAVLRFAQWVQTETGVKGYDRRWVQVSDDGGSTWTTHAEWDSGHPNQLFFAPAIVDLSAYAGRTIRLRFVFDTVDQIANNFEGWYVDDVGVLIDPPPLRPDLLVAALTNSTTRIAPRASFLVSNLIRNQGQQEAGSFLVSFHLSADAAYGGSDDIAFDQTRLFSSLPVGLSTPGATTSLSLPALAPLGRYYVCAQADGAGQVDESDEQNNALCTATMLEVAQAALAVVELAGPATAVVDGAMPVSCTLANTGGRATQVLIALFLQQDGQPKIRIGQQLVASLSQAAVPRTYQTVLTVPKTLAPGSYTLSAFLDEPNEYSEADEADNILPGNLVTLVPTGVDFVITAVSGDPVVTRGGTFTASATVLNQGTTTSEKVQVGFYLSRDAVVTSVDRRIGSWAAGGLAPGTGYTAPITLNVPSSFAPGLYYLGAIADFNHARLETNETNNTLAGQVVTVQ